MHKKSRLQRRRKNDPTVDCPNHIDLRAPRVEEWGPWVSAGTGSFFPAESVYGDDEYEELDRWEG